MHIAELILEIIGGWFLLSLVGGCLWVWLRGKEKIDFAVRAEEESEETRKSEL